MTACLRSGDVAGRLGGDEFAMVLAGGEADIDGLIQRVRAEIASAMSANGWSVSASMGALSFPHAPNCAHSALAAADSLMYADKTARKSRRFSPHSLSSQPFSPPSFSQ
jgi:diguanylate cyclase (GGDEF)-like protein